jgi:hypothetical protein
MHQPAHTPRTRATVHRTRSTQPIAREGGDEGAGFTAGSFESFGSHTCTTNT